MAEKERPKSESRDDKENAASRATGPMPLIPRTGSAQRLRLSSNGRPSPTKQAQQTESAAESSGSSTATPRRNSPRHPRKQPVSISRELTASPQQPSPPPSSPVSSRAPVNLRLDLHALKRTLTEAQVVANHRHHVAHSIPGRATLPTSGSLGVPQPYNAPVTPPALDGRTLVSRSEIMLRKKSGELVRPAIRTPGSQPRKITKSEPTTPTGPKFVHFDSQLEHVKLFLAEQKPAAVSRDGSPTETSEGELSSTNEFPFPLAYASSDDEKLRKALQIRVNIPPPHLQNIEADVRLESVTLSEDARALNGTIVVRNLSYQKWVIVRFTLDNWTTRSEISARYVDSISDGFDRFAFSIRLVDVLPRIEAKTMQLAVRFSIEGREMWDNNGERNYRVEFWKRRVSAPAAFTPGSSKSLPTNPNATQEGRTEWPVKSAISVSTQMADLRRSLEGVVSEELSPPTVVVKRSASVSFRERQDGTRSVPGTAREREFEPLALGRRYNFGEALRTPQQQRQEKQQQQQEQETQQQSTIPFPSEVQKLSSSSPSQGVPFPTLGSSPPRTSPPLQIPFSSPPTGDLPRLPPRGSPRDAPDSSADAPFLGRRNHQRSYFDTWPGFASASVRKTPPGTPGRFNSYPPLSPPAESVREPPPLPHALPTTLPHVLPDAQLGPVVLPWANLIPLPPSPTEEQEDSTASSTPSITDTVSLSPSSPPTASILPAMILPEAEGSPNSYNYFLDRFCFYTGPGELTAESTPRRTLSTPDIPSSYPSPNLDRFVAAFSPPPVDHPGKMKVLIPSPPPVPGLGLSEPSSTSTESTTSTITPMERSDTI
ncbi:hypothetical protein DACRYDRAFT_20130 [Dacryopinax primogenitus]|uniref:CBM21 domain-containing protein n=1 Tax=Dacryopinax primogenitus (strain DJM 731) TaxID=1858805 RepID=M5GBH3_DACPD|nr:uncharacterized protein DACRYDRAFT_20130 [Dacryopinax primogenitus]EJU05740.1 hypothetical protein DACRYDRAFT_20130 [Dacryopinax primogenitus]